MTSLEQYRIVLVRPEDGANVGAVCRIMKNMGLRNLSIIQGRELDKNRIKQLALRAYDIFQNATLYSEMKPALRDSMLTAGFTRRTGRWRKYISYTPEQLRDRIQTIPVNREKENGPAKPKYVTLVFGNERNGLNDEELSLCDCAVHIPTVKQFPSLNLSHAVGIAVYLLAGAAHRPITGSNLPVTRSQLNETVQSITASLAEVGFFTLTDDIELGRFFRDIFARALLSEREAKRLEEIFKKIADMKIHKRETGSTSISIYTPEGRIK